MIQTKKAKKITFPYYDRKKVAFWNPYLSKNRRVPLKINDQEFGIRINPDIISNLYADIENPILFGVSNGEEQFNLEVPIELLRLIIHSFIDPLAIESLHSELMIHILNILLSDFIEIIEKKTGFSLFFHNEPFNIVEKETEKAEFFCKHQNGISYAVNIYATQQTLKKILDMFAEGTPPNNLADIHTPIYILAAIASLNIYHLKRLKAGQIIVLGTNKNPINHSFILIGQKLICDSVWDGTQLKVSKNLQLFAPLRDKIMAMGMSTENTEQNIPAPTEKAASVDSAKYPLLPEGFTIENLPESPADLPSNLPLKQRLALIQAIKVRNAERETKKLEKTPTTVQNTTSTSQVPQQSVAPPKKSVDKEVTEIKGEILEEVVANYAVPVLFELAETEIAVKQLQNIKEGFIFDLAKPINDFVNIKVNSRIIAKGEIVQIGDNFGVLVKEVL